MLNVAAGPNPTAAFASFASSVFGYRASVSSPASGKKATAPAGAFGTASVACRMVLSTPAPPAAIAMRTGRWRWSHSWVRRETGARWATRSK